MKLAISNIAWDISADAIVYKMMENYGFTGLEIAPTRLFPENPYENIKEAQVWKNEIYAEYGFEIPSMQSIWYGRQEKIFGSSEEREKLTNYTKKAIDFAASLGCKNLVFGCPRNRYMPEHADMEIAVSFFRELGDYAFAHGTVIGMEANPTIYNTNFVNKTMEALEFIERVGSKGFLLNLDTGTMIQNDENADILGEKVQLINHVHMSEPGLKVIEKRLMHRRLREILEKEEYQGFVSIEMGKVEKMDTIEAAMAYVKEIFS